MRDGRHGTVRQDDRNNPREIRLTLLAPYFGKGGADVDVTGANPGGWARTGGRRFEAVLNFRVPDSSWFSRGRRALVRRGWVQPLHPFCALGKPPASTVSVKRVAPLRKRRRFLKSSYKSAIS